MSTKRDGQPQPRDGHFPTDVGDKVGVFDRFAERASAVFSKAWFFAFCVILVVVWAPSYFVLGSLDTWQLVISTATTIITFLMVALLQNSQTRADLAIQGKLNAIADVLADLMESLADGDKQATVDIEELEAAVGLERREDS